jgi:hypothetical protein
MKVINYLAGNFSSTAVKILNPIQEVCGLNTNRDTGYSERIFRGCLIYLQTSVGIVSGKGYGCFIRNSLKFIIHQPHYERICKFKESNAVVHQNINNAKQTQFRS